MSAATQSGPQTTLFGLPPQQGRWLFIPLGMTVLACLGSVYSWSIFRTPLERELGVSAGASLLPHTFVLLSYAILMPVAGFYIPRLGPRLTCAVGGVVVGLGYILASFANQIGGLIFGYGVVVGAGIGIAYGVPMVVVSRWFPDKKGLAVGLTIIGFGVSPLITAPLANELIGAHGVRGALRILGVAFTAIILAISLILKSPPQDWSPQSGSGTLTPSSFRADSRPLFKSRAFYGLWVCYAIAALAGLSAIGISSPVGQEIIAIDPPVAAASVSLFALFNGVSRPLFGWLSDRFQPRYVAIFSYVLILVACLLMAQAKTGDTGRYLVGFSLFWFCLGGWLAMAPTLTLRFFNPAQYAQNYGIVFTAYGAGALLGTLIIGRIREVFGSYNAVFYPMAALAILGIIVASLWLRRDGPIPLE